jgi:hypothetical protein
MAQDNPLTPTETTVANLPATDRPTRLWFITDAAFYGDVSTGGGTIGGFAYYNGTAWIWPALTDTSQAITLAAAVTTFAVTGAFAVVTGDAGANTIATITGGRTGQRLALLFVDALVTVTDDNTHAANSVDLSAAFVSVADITLELIHNGTSWYELSRSVN